MCRRIKEWVDQDDDAGIVAKWLDESHLNKYFLLHPPARTLDQRYLFSERCMDQSCQEPMCLLLRATVDSPVMGKR